MFNARCWMIGPSLAWASLLVLSATALGQPTVGDLSPRGLQIDGQTRIVFQGSGLDSHTRLLASFPIAQQTVIGEATPQRLELELTLDADTPAGLHQVWLMNKQGLSAPILISVDQIPQLDVNQSVEQLPVALHGTIRGNQVQSIPLPVSEGQRVVVDVQARRLEGALRPVARVFAPDGRQVAAGNPRPDLAGDVRFEFVAPVTGTMVLEIQDLLLRGALPGHFKVVVGDLRGPVAAWPTGVQLDHANEARFQLIGASPDTTGSLPSPVASPGWYGLGIAPSMGYSGNQPRVRSGQATELVEQDFAGETPPDVALPLGISAVLSSPGEHDRFRILVPKATQLGVNVWADRLGLEIDPIAVARVSGGPELGRGDDMPGFRDPQFQFAVPSDQEIIEIEVWDLLGLGSPSSVYRIEIFDAGAPGIEMPLSEDHIGVSPDGGSLIVVPINRQRFQGDVQLSLLPEVPGVTVSGGYVPADSDRGLLRLQATADAQAQVTQLVAMTEVEGLGPVAARRAPGELDALLPWRKQELAIAPIDAIGLDLEVAKLSDDSVLWQGGVLRFPVSLQRREDATGAVRLRLLTTQQMPRKKIKNDNQEEEVDAVERALRLDDNVTISEGQEMGELPISIPVDLKPGKWGLAVVAELLSEDKMRVVSSAVSPVVFPQVKQALSLALSGEKKIELKLGEAGTGVFRGTITRHNGFEGPVVVTISGFPEMTLPPEVELSADQTEFELPVSLGAEAKPEQLQTLHVVAQAWDEDGYQIAESPGERVHIILVETPNP